MMENFNFDWQSPPTLKLSSIVLNFNSTKLQNNRRQKIPQISNPKTWRTPAKLRLRRGLIYTEEKEKEAAAEESFEERESHRQLHTIDQQVVVGFRGLWTPLNVSSPASLICSLLLLPQISVHSLSLFSIVLLSFWFLRVLSEVQFPQYWLPW